METNVTNGRFGFRTFSKCGHEVLPKCGKPGCKFFESFWEPVWDNYSENNGSVFAYTHQTTHLQLSLQLYASLSMWVKFPYLGRVAFWEYFEKQTCYLKKGMYEVYEKKSKCENTTYFPQIMVHTNFERTFKRIVFNRNILFLECSIKD